jgi:Domain of unknown function (DUF4166)
MEGATTSIYQRLLGADFERLGPILQEVHGAVPNLRAHGRVTVTHGGGRLVRLLNRLMHVPPPGVNVDLRLQVARTHDREHWVRDFGGKPLVTEQWAQNGFFIEAVGPIHMAMRLRVQGSMLCFDPVRTTCWGIPVPGWLRVKVRAEVHERGEGWHILVETNSGLLGLMFRYEGLIALES